MNLVKLDYDVFFRRRDVGKLAFDKIVTPPKKGERRWLRYGGGGSASEAGHVGR